MATTWLLSYIFVLIVPILFSLSVYWHAKQTIDDQIERGIDSLLLQMQGAIDNRVAAMKGLVLQIYGNVKVQDLLYSNKYARSDYQYDLYKVTQDLKAYKPSYDAFDEFYIYWSPSDSVIMPNTYAPGELAFDDLYGGGDMTLSQWREQVRGIDKRRFITTSRRIGPGETQHYLTYISSFPADNNNQSVGSVVVMANTGQLLDVLANVRRFNGSSVFVLNERNEVLVSDAEGTGDLPAIGRFSGETNRFRGIYHGEKSQFYSIKSNHSGLTYLIVISDKVAWREAADMRRLVYYSIAFSLLGGLLLSLFFLRRNYKPLGRLIRALSLQSNGTTEIMDNEFRFIEHALSQTLVEKEHIRRRMKQQQNQLRASFIARLLKGRLESGIPHDESLAAFDITFLSDYFGVILFDLEDHPTFLERLKNMHVADKIRLMQFIVVNVTEELAGREHLGYTIEVDDMMACLVNFPGPPSQDAVQQLVRLAGEAQQFLEAKFDIRLTVAIGGIHETPAGIAEAYKESLAAMEYKLVMDKQDIVTYEELQRESAPEPSAGYYYPLQVEQQLINYAKVGDIAKARSTLNDIIERNFSRDALKVGPAKCLMIDLVGTLMKLGHEIGEPQEEDAPLHPNAIEQLLGLKTVKEMHQRLEAMLEAVCRHTAAKLEHNRSKSKHRELNAFAASVIRFVDGHYEDCNLNVSMVGDAFKMKATYLSKLFKDQTGETLLDYINRLRIDKAKLLLQREDKPLKDVAFRCGFGDLNTFMRTFKKYEGITPGQYKLME